MGGFLLMGKKYRLAILIPLFILIISGCSAVSDLNNSIDYVTKATTYIDKMNTHSNTIPPIFEKAVTDNNARTQLEQQLATMKTDIQNFNQLTPPEFAAGIHQSIEEKNQTILNGIDLYTTHIKNGTVNPDMIQNLEVFQTIKELNSLLSQLEQLKP